MRTPAAIAEPMTPATFGPMACISRKFAGFSFWPTTWETRAAIGTAETPAEHPPQNKRLSQAERESFRSAVF